MAQGGTPNEPPKDLTLEQVASVLNVHVQTVRKLVTSGALKGYKVTERDWRVTQKELDKYRGLAPPG